MISENNLKKRYTIESFIVGESNSTAHIAAKGIIKNPGISNNPLFLFSESGLGKTHLAQAIGNGLKKKYNKKVLYSHGRRVLFSLCALSPDK